MLGGDEKEGELGAGSTRPRLSSWGLSGGFCHGVSSGGRKILGWDKFPSDVIMLRRPFLSNLFPQNLYLHIVAPPFFF